MADTKTDNLNRDFIVECAVGYSLSDLAEAINPSHSRSKRKAPERPPDLAPARPPRLLTERDLSPMLGLILPLSALGFRSAGCQRQCRIAASGMLRPSMLRLTASQG